MRTKFLLVFALLITFTESYKQEVKATDHFDFTKGLLFLQQGEAPRFIERLKNLTVIDGDRVQMTAKVIGIPDPEIQVFKNGLPLKITALVRVYYDKGTVTILIEYVQLWNEWTEDEGVYTIRATNIYGTSDTSCRLTVTDEGWPKSN